MGRRGTWRTAAASVVVLTALAGCSSTAGTPAPPSGSTTDAMLSAAPPNGPTPSVTLTPTSTSPTLSAVVVLDPGHNGGNTAALAEINRLVPAGGFTKPCNTTGTQTNAGYPEHAFNLDVAHRAAELLKAEGVTVLLTRTDDTGVGPCVDARAAAANDAHADLAVSVHADGAASSARGFHVIVPALAPDGGNAAVLEPSAQAGASLLAAFGAATGAPPATYPGALVQPGLTRRNDLAGLNLARVPAVFIECANMRNDTDATAVTDPTWRQRAADGIADGVLGFLRSR